MSKPVRILVVDDEPGVRSLLKEVLGRQGWSVQTADRVEPALKLLKPGDFDLVISDLFMPGPPWTLMAERLDAWGATSIPLVLISGSGFMSGGETGRFSCVAASLAKPFQLEDVIRCVRRVLKLLRAMVCDNDDALRAVICHHLEQAGYETFPMASGLEAIEQFRHVQPDVVVMDLRMPGLGGIEATQRLRREPGGATVPIVVLTAVQEQEAIQQAAAAGADEYMIKPFHAANLLKTIRRTLDRVSAP